jgi:hypothetical protein
MHSQTQRMQRHSHTRRTQRQRQKPRRRRRRRQTHTHSPQAVTNTCAERRRPDSASAVAGTAPSVGGATTHRTVTPGTAKPARTTMVPAGSGFGSSTFLPCSAASSGVCTVTSDQQLRRCEYRLHLWRCLRGGLLPLHLHLLGNRPRIRVHDHGPRTSWVHSSGGRDIVTHRDSTNGASATGQRQRQRQGIPTGVSCVHSPL